MCGPRIIPKAPLWPEVKNYCPPQVYTDAMPKNYTGKKILRSLSFTYNFKTNDVSSTIKSEIA